MQFSFTFYSSAPPLLGGLPPPLHGVRTNWASWIILDLFVSQLHHIIMGLHLVHYLQLILLLLHNVGVAAEALDSDVLSSNGRVTDHHVVPGPLHLLLADAQFEIGWVTDASARQLPHWFSRLDTVVGLEPGVGNVWVLLTPEQPHAHLSPFCDPSSLFLLSIAPSRHSGGHAVVGAVTSIWSLVCVAVELHLLALVNNLPVPAHYVVCPVLVRCAA